MNTDLTATKPAPMPSIRVQVMPKRRRARSAAAPAWLRQLVTADTLASLQTLVEVMNESGTDHCTHGVMTIEKLARLLFEDAGMAISRPGSWEGAGMIDVLRSHGYTT